MSNNLKTRAQPTPTSNAGDVDAAYEAFGVSIGGFDMENNHWHDMGTDEVFKAGWDARAATAESDLSKARKIIERFEIAGTALLFKSTSALMVEDTQLVPNRNIKSLAEAIKEAKAFMENNKENE